MDFVRLITFDAFGTLLDWQTYAGKTGGIGFARPFTDGRAVQHLASMTMIGCVSRCDAEHLLNVQRSLGVAFDVTVTDAGTWDTIVETVTRKLGFDRGEWLHVSTYVEDDLAPAKARGVRTCFVPRPGGSHATLVEQVPPELICSDLWQLVDRVAGVAGPPVRYTVKAQTRSIDVAHDFCHWMRYEHGPELLAVHGCQRFEVLRLGEAEVQCDYWFTNQAALDRYFDGPAQAMRAKGRARFAEADVAFSRSVAPLVTAYGERARYDFQRPTRGSAT